MNNLSLFPEDFDDEQNAYFKLATSRLNSIQTEIQRDLSTYSFLDLVSSYKFGNRGIEAGVFREEIRRQVLIRALRCGVEMSELPKAWADFVALTWS